MDAVGVTEEGEHGRLIEGHPVGDRAAEARRDEMREVGEPADDVGVGEATAILQRLGQVPVEQVEHRLNARRVELLEEPPVEVDTALVRRAAARRQDARPGDAEAVGIRAELGHQPNVVAVAVVVVVGNVARVAVGDLPGVRANVSQIDARRPSSVTAPSIWYAEAAKPHMKSSGKRAASASGWSM